MSEGNGKAFDRILLIGGFAVQLALFAYGYGQLTQTVHDMGSDFSRRIERVEKWMDETAIAKKK